MTFREWITHPRYLTSNRALGDLARDIASDIACMQQCGTGESYAALEMHLVVTHHACDAALDTLQRAYTNYRRAHPGQPTIAESRQALKQRFLADGLTASEESA